MNRHAREAFDRLQALPERTSQQQRLIDNMLRWDELEAHHDNREREWHAQDNDPATTPPAVHDCGDYLGRYASNGGFAEALAQIDEVLAAEWQPAQPASVDGRAR
jgi:hypothetical protein